MGALRRSILVAGAATTLAMTPGTAVGDPAEHFEEEIVGEELACDPPYTIVAGVGRITLREGSGAAGNGSFSVTFTPHHVVLEDAAGGHYDLRGAAHFGGSYNATRESVQQHTGTLKLQLVEHASGRVENVNQTIHFTTVSGNVKDFSFGTCRLEFHDED